MQLSITGVNPITKQVGTNTISIDEASAAVLGGLVLQYLGYEPRIADPDNPGELMVNPQTPGAALLAFIDGHLRYIAAQQAKENDAAAGANQAALATIAEAVIS